MGVGAGDAGAGGASPPSWGRGLAAEGCTSTGATMSVVARGAPAASASAGCCGCRGGHCCVNIYVNSNVQGVTNSVLVGSKVVMRDPGPRVSIRQPRRDGRRRREGRKRISRQQHKPTKIGVVAAVVSLLLFVAAAAAAVLCIRLSVRVST